MQTRVLCHDINVKDASPIKQHPYRVNATKRALMKDEVEYLVSDGLAEPAAVHGVHRASSSQNLIDLTVFAWTTGRSMRSLYQIVFPCLE